MAQTLRPKNRCKDCGDTWYPRGRNLSNKCPNCGGINVEISKDGLIVGLVIFAFFGIFGLFADNKKTDYPNTPTIEAEQVSSITPDIVEAQLPPSADSQSASDIQAVSSVESLAETVANTSFSESEQSEFREVFYKWTESEKQLRDGYTELLNDHNASQFELDSRKSEYLKFVDNKNKKCGNLDSKHSSNINSDVSDVKFNKEDIVVLHCHQEENLLKLSAFEKEE